MDNGRLVRRAPLRVAAKRCVRRALVERQTQLFGGAAVGGGDVEQLGGDAGLAAERLQPQRPVVLVLGELALVEDHDHRLVLRGRLAKELLDGGVVVLLLREHGDLRTVLERTQAMVEHCGDGATVRDSPAVRLGAGLYTRINEFQQNLIYGKPNDWHCLAGARYLYICEDGKVHWCSQQRGFPGIPLEEYTMEDFKREYKTEKWCAPTCTIQCVHQVGILDNWRDPQMSEAEVRKEMQKKKEAERLVQILRPQ